MFIPLISVCLEEEVSHVGKEKGRGLRGQMGKNLSSDKKIDAPV